MHPWNAPRSQCAPARLRTGVVLGLALAGLLTSADLRYADGAEATSQDKTAASPEFTRDVAPLLQKHCYKCHGTEGGKGGLDLRTVGAMLQGGESGDPAIVPGKSAESLLIR
ncbi:c-type cytochrome domain-containing protein, partial [Singulisphaera rosea]